MVFPPDDVTVPPVNCWLPEYEMITMPEPPVPPEAPTPGVSCQPPTPPPPTVISVPLVTAVGV